jgi:hypothetical protein
MNASCRTKSGIIDLAEARFRRDVEHLHQLGPRALHEFLLELAAERMLRVAIEAKLRRYGRLDPKVLRALGGDEP